MKSSVYIETSVISYLTARPSSDVRSAAFQNITVDWWDNRRSDFDLYVSEFVIVEASRGNKEASARRLSAINNIAELRITEAVRILGNALIKEGALPEKAALDAFHVAVATVNGINYLLTWNCAHIANAVMRPKIESICRKNNYEPPIICTPSELLES
jgi:predicted nucleic acid-binding protein